MDSCFSPTEIEINKTRLKYTIMRNELRKILYEYNKYYFEKAICHNSYNIEILIMYLSISLS